METEEGSQKPKNSVISVVVFVIGLITLIVGVVFLIIKLVQKPLVQDGDYLVSADEWVLNDDTNCVNSEENDEGNAEETNCLPNVIWKFTEIGKGTLTTNGHKNDYDFIWAIEGEKLLIETNWLYNLENKYNYKLDQEKGVLILTEGENELRFEAVFENKE